MKAEPEEITQLLLNWSHGDRASLDALVPFVYEELRRIAGRASHHERSGHTLQTTALVHEAFLRLVQQDRVQWQNRAQFYAVAASLVRRILVDYARGGKAAKRGGDVRKTSLDEGAVFAPERPADIVELDAALTKLEALDARKSRIVELKFFAGMKAEEIAEVLNVSEVTVRRNWSMARAWLFRELSKEPSA